MTPPDTSLLPPWARGNVARYEALTNEWSALEREANDGGLDMAAAQRQIDIEQELEELYPKLPAEIRERWDRGEPV